MTHTSFQRIQPHDHQFINLIAQWYKIEWNIPQETTVKKLSGLPMQNLPMQILMTIDNTPVATGGLYTHVGLLDHQPEFSQYGPWLALVYTTVENRNQGYGALLCEKLQTMAKDLGLQEIYLFTFTAEVLYKRLGWEQLERLNYKGKDTVVMKKCL